jgi:hypothetical protein
MSRKIVAHIARPMLRARCAVLAEKPKVSKVNAPKGNRPDTANRRAAAKCIKYMGFVHAQPPNPVGLVSDDGPESEVSEVLLTDIDAAIFSAHTKTALPKPTKLVSRRATWPQWLTLALASPVAGGWTKGGQA